MEQNVIRKIVTKVLFICLLLPATISWAQAATNQEKAFEAALKEAQQSQTAGPAEIAVKDQARITLPAGFAYIPQPQAGALMTAMGNQNTPNLQGLIVPQNEKEDWFVVIKYHESGYIKDDDAKKWNVEELFNSIKKGTEKANKERKEHGFRESEIIGWVEKPTYDSDKKQLVWSISSRDKGVRIKKGEQTINYNTYVLGREGYLSMGLVTDLKNIDAHKTYAHQLLGATEFVAGKRYDDYKFWSDGVAEYGVSALVAGGAVGVAKKLGMMGIILAFFAKFAKLAAVVGIAIAGVATAAVRFFRKRKEKTAESSAPPEN